MTHYEVLGVERDATAAQIRAAYLARARQLHPDRHASATAAELARAQRAMQEVNAAWSVLGDPQARRDYDAALRARETTAAAASMFADGGARPAPAQTGPPPVVLDWDDDPGPRLPAIVRIGPVVLLLAVLAAIFVVTAFAAGNSSVDVPRPRQRATPAVGGCIDVSNAIVAEVPCNSVNALRIERHSSDGRCGRRGEVPIVWDDDTVLCVAPRS